MSGRAFLLLAVAADVSGLRLLEEDDREYDVLAIADRTIIKAMYSPHQCPQDQFLARLPQVVMRGGKIVPVRAAAAAAMGAAPDAVAAGAARPTLVATHVDAQLTQARVQGYRSCGAGTACCQGGTAGPACMQDQPDTFHEAQTSHPSY